MKRPAKATVDALLELLDPTAVVEATRALEVILARQAERAGQVVESRNRATQDYFARG